MADVRMQEAGSIRVSVGDRIEDLDTPLILADLDQMERNIADWQSWMDDHGVKFRVHIKTHMVPEIALQQLHAVLAPLGATDVVGKSFGVIKLRIAGGETDFSLPRRESKTGAGHRGFAVAPDPTLSDTEEELVSTIVPVSVLVTTTRYIPVSPATMLLRFSVAAVAPAMWLATLLRFPRFSRYKRAAAGR